MIATNNKSMSKTFKNILIFCAGAFGYGTMEIAFRGYTHWSMLLTGGFCLVTLTYIYRGLSGYPLELRALAGCVTITAFELVAGLVVNLWFNMAVWDYSALPFNYRGQISLLFSVIWFFLCYILFAIAALFSYARNLRRIKT